MLKHTKLFTLVIASFLITASAAYANNSIPSTFNWPSGWEKTVMQMPTKSDKAQYTLSEKLRALKADRVKAKKK